jgi:hypothetical protein
VTMLVGILLLVSATVLGVMTGLPKRQPT